MDCTHRSGRGRAPIRTLARLALAAPVALATTGFALSAPPEPGQRSAIVLTIEGAIGPASADYIVRGLGDAADKGAGLVILRMDTPGGLDASMRDIIRAILASPVPVAAYVAPSGARAASAGTYILYASHIAAMAPGTNLGAATPVSLGGGLPFGGGGKEGQNGDEQPTAAPDPNDAHARKAINDAAAYIRALAALRGRNADWADAAVRQAQSLPAREALELRVIDLIAPDLGALLEQADGRTVSIAGKRAQLATAGLSLEPAPPTWRTRLLATIGDPNVALILMMIGIYGLIFEFLNPGTVLPGTVGAISLLTGLYALAILPVNFVALGLVLLGFALMIGEAFVPSFGALGIGGAVSVALGATLMVDTTLPGYGVTWPVIAGIIAASLAFSLLVVPIALRAQRRRVVSGREEMLGMQARVLDWSGGHGHVFLHGERWRAVSSAQLRKGDAVRVVALDGLTLKVEPDVPAKR